MAGSFNKDLQNKNLSFQEKMQQKLAAGSPTPAPAESDPFSTMPGKTADLQDRAWLTKRVSTLEQELLKAQSTGRALKARVDECFEIPGRRRKLSAEEYADLKENLRQNPLASPVTVQLRPEGGYFIVSGNNRVAIYRELGFEEIDIWLTEATPEQADDLAFYANLLQSPLPDYEKFLGFKKLKAKYPDMQQQDIAERTGKSKALISILFAFESLPEDALKMLDANPALVGANAAKDLAAAAKKGKDKEVVAALKLVEAGELDEGKAAQFALRKPDAGAKTTGAAERVFKIGNSNYCAMRRAKGTLRIEFKDAAEAEEVEKAFAAFLDQRIDELKKSKKGGS